MDIDLLVTASCTKIRGQRGKRHEPAVGTDGRCGTHTVARHWSHTIIFEMSVV